MPARSRDRGAGAAGGRDVLDGRGARDEEPIDPPPWGTWPSFYAAVLLFLALLIALFTWFTRAFSA